MKNQQAFKNLAVWNESIELVKSTYEIASVFPEDEKNGIVKSLKKQALNIPGGISKAMQVEEAEMRKQYFEQSLMAITEIETLLIIAQRLDFIDPKDVVDYTNKSEQVAMQIKGLIQKFNR